MEVAGDRAGGEGKGEGELPQRPFTRAPFPLRTAGSPCSSGRTDPPAAPRPRTFCGELPQLRYKSAALDSSKPLPTSLQRDFIPEEIFVALTSAANPVPCPSVLRPPKKTKSIKDFQGCIRTTDGVWQHPVRRNKFRYLIEHPICLTGAGRDVSFLYDLAAEKEAKNPPPTPVSHKTSTNLQQQQEPTATKLPTGIADSLVPEEFHILKNRGVLRLEYYDDKYTTLLEDDENRLRVFPSMKPSGRLEVLQLMKVMDTMLERAGTNNKDVGVTGVSQMHNVLEVLKVEQNIYNIVFHEIIRQVSVDCAERGELLSKLRQSLLDEYRELYELQRRRLEAQIHQLTQEKELWSNATYELALKVIEKNKLILARRMYDSEKAWVKGMRHFIMMLASQDATDLSTLQELTQEFRERLSQIGTEVEQIEETSRDRARSIQNGLAGWLSYFQNHVLGKGTYTFAKGASLLDQILVDLKVWEKMLNEELAQFGGEILLLRQEPLTVTTNLQKQWVDLGLVVHGRHKTLKGRMPVELKMLERINKQTTLLCEQYRIRICGDNGSARILTSLINSLEDWSFKLLANKQKGSMHETEWIKFFQTVSEWIAQIDDLLSFIGSGDTVEDRRLRAFHSLLIPEDVFKKIQQWILTTTSGSEKENDQLSHELNDFHNALSKWMVNLLIHMAPDHISRDTLPLTDAEAARQAERKLLNIFKLEGEATGLAAKLSTFSCYIVSCCKEMVATITRQKMVTLQPDAEHELQQLERIKTECLDWIETCNLLLSGMKTTPTTLISQEDLVSLFGLEVLQLKRQLPPRPEQRVESSSTTDVPVEEEKKDKEAVDVLKDQEAAEQKQVLEAEEQPPVPSTSTGEQAESLAVTYPVRYIGDDANVYVKTMQVQEITVSRRELHASQWTTKASKKEFELLASLEILEERLVEAEKRAQQAEEKSEALHEDLEEALAKIQNMEGEPPKLKDSEQKETKLKAEVVVKEQTESPSQPSTPKPRTKKFPKPKR
uniref:axonemal dynein light chain domain-containing protein 1 isoform X6 n=1 Tax=Podarcis muralis TaxID=64176 RepID=UPI00109F3F44|nr:axonemal dynein light chain domain-containing protein 1 isoform X6 [Podarcis muralis]